jgi:hypothetical protein
MTIAQRAGARTKPALRSRPPLAFTTPARFCHRSVSMRRRRVIAAMGEASHETVGQSAGMRSDTGTVEGLEAAAIATSCLARRVQCTAIVLLTPRRTSMQKLPEDRHAGETCRRGRIGSGRSHACRLQLRDAPALDLILVPGGPGVRALVKDPSRSAWTSSSPSFRGGALPQRQAHAGHPDRS